MTIPELLLPAGGFEAAIAAFEGGADAIYLGLKAFSARKQARNFDGLEYRRTLKEARVLGKRVYVALNTLVTEADLPALAEALAFLGRFPPDAIIFQDWGLARVARKRLPGIPLHASTQTALQTPEAVDLALEAGATRVVLPRETSILEMAELHAARPGVEIETFVHGALCYSYSGLCLASGLMLGRSGNRGECAQLCRSWYRGAAGPLGGDGYWFSCKDLSLVDRLEELCRAGVASLKVEGRMKSPEYVHGVASLYRAALDRLAGKPVPEAELRTRGEAASLAFSRAPTTGYAAHHGGSDILDPAYPGHRGTRLGEVVGRRGSALHLRLESALDLRDGIQAFRAPQEGGLAEAVQFSATGLRDPVTEKRLVHAEAGAEVLIDAPGDPRLLSALGVGARLHRISSRALDRRQPSPEEYEPLVSLLPATLGLLGEGGDQARITLELALPSLDGRASVGEPRRLVDVESLPLQRSRQPGGFLKALELFGESGDRDFRLAVTIAPDDAGEGPGVGMADLFIPPSLLKKAKNRLYEACAAELAGSVGAWIAATLEFAREGSDAEGGVDRGLPHPERARLVFPDPRLPTGMPYATPALLEAGAALPDFGEWLWLPMAPLVAKTQAYLDLVAARVTRELAGGRRIALGLNGMHQVAAARAMAETARAAGLAEGLAFFVDCHLYVANLSALSHFARTIPGLAFAYRWLEGEAGDFEGLAASLGPGLPALVEPGPGFSPPLFLSKACLLRHHPGAGHCPPACPKRMTSRLRDRDREYVAIVEDCVSMLFALPKQGPFQSAAGLATLDR